MAKARDAAPRLSQYSSLLQPVRRHQIRSCLSRYPWDANPTHGRDHPSPTRARIPSTWIFITQRACHFGGAQRLACRPLM